MKVLASVLLLLSIAVSALADQSTLMLSTSKASYTSGSRAVLIARSMLTPSDSKSEFVFKAKLNSTNVKITSISSSVAYTVTNELPAGNFVWQVQTFVQNKYDAQKLNETIVFFGKEVLNLQRKIEAETNAQVLAALNAQLARDNSIIQRARAQLDKIRSLVSTQSINFSVNPPTFGLANRAVPTLSIVPDNISGIYLVGAAAQFSVTLSGTTFDGEAADWTYDAEIPAVGSKPAIELTKTVNSATQVTFNSAVFASSSAGWRQFVPKFKYRLKSQYTKFKEAVGLAVIRKNEFIKDKNLSNDPKEIAYYQSLISEIDLLIAALSDLGLSYQPFMAASYDFKVKDASLPKGFQITPPVDGFVLSEGGLSKTFQIRLTSDPDSDVFVTFTNDSQITAVAPVVFNSHNWNIPQSVSIQAFDDNISESDHSSSLQISSTGGDYNGITSSILITILDDDVWSSVSIAADSGCAIRKGALYCWGGNEYGQLGMGDTVTRTVPTLVPTMDSGVLKVVGNGFHRCAIKNLQVYCWGRNNKGQIGINSSGTNVLTPFLVSGAGTVSDIAAGNEASCSIKSSSKNVFCWGDNSYGQAGVNSTATSLLVPTLVPGGFQAKSIATGPTSSCFVTLDNKVYCSGGNGAGEVGDGTTIKRISPVLVVGSDSLGTINSVTVAAGSRQGCLGYQNGVKCWGDGIYYSMGTGVNGTYAIPASVVGISDNVVALSAGTANVCAVVSDRVKCWGWGNSGQNGNGSTTSAQYATEIADTYNKATFTASGGYSTCAIIDGNVKCWGVGSSYKLGNGIASDSLTPVTIVNPSLFRKNRDLL
ncbi:hypothetical protein [Bdellovibrio sp. NC01]|uniref:RCC1 domain-containing protein n=1 Tax=Bdellovibrio sp. NC01 TaxID=2220073 RepID=UPI0011581D08|nr:hypothetical protein [Bdellovibrio sp. NC01]QDK37931.1 hypothetical protein DOE51_10210 [Bdellovibrio sp. NC01]